MPTGETWAHCVIFNYPGIVAFLVMDAAIFIAAATLLSVQATQVKFSCRLLSFHSMFFFSAFV